MRDSTRLALIAGMVKGWDLNRFAGDRLEALSKDQETFAALLIIRGLLHALFRSDEVAADWLRDEKEILHSQTALHWILDGKEGVLKVRRVVERMAGQ